MTTTAARVRTTPFRLGAKPRKAWLLVHIAAAGSWLGIDLVLAVLVVVALGGDPAVAESVYRVLEHFAVGPLVVFSLSGTLHEAAASAREYAADGVPDVSALLAPPIASTAAVLVATALTDREREIVALVAEGLSNDEIGARLVVGPATARTHVSRAMVTLGARDRA